MKEQKVDILVPIIILLCAAIVAIALLYNKENEKSQKIEKNTVYSEQTDDDYVFKKQSECMEICKNSFNQEIKENPSVDYKFISSIYNKEFNSCFYESNAVSISGDDSGRYAFINDVINCQTREKVLTYIVSNGEVLSSGCDDCATSIEDFDSRKNKYLK
jgi:hypothetical protein